MLPKEVSAEVTIEVPKCRVDVVRILLRIVELDQEIGPLYARVGHLTPLGRTSPREIGVFDTSFTHRGSAERRNVVGHYGDVGVDDGHEHVLLFRRKRRSRDSDGVKRVDHQLGSCDHVRRRHIVEDRRVLLVGVQRREKRARRIFLLSQCS